MKLTKTQAEKIFSAKDYEEAKKTAAELGYEMTEEEDAELKKTFTRELSDEELNQVAGGGELCRKKDSSGKWIVYEWNGGDKDLKYLCPNCGRPVHRGTFGLYYCDPCDESWFFVNSLEPNVENWERTNLDSVIRGGLSY